MNKTGVTPSIDNLAKLADEYVNTEDKSKFAEKAVKLLGRGYQTLIPLLALGGDEFRRQTAAIEDNIIATNDSVATTLEYQQSMDNLRDKTTGLKNELAEGLLPALNDVLAGLTAQIDKTGKVNEVSDRLWAAQKKGNLTWAETFVMVTQIKNGFEDTAYAESVLAGITEDTTAVVYDERQEVILLNQTIRDATGATEEYTEALTGTAAAIIELEKAAFAKEAIELLNAAVVAGTIDADTYKVKLADLMRNMMDLPESTIAATLALYDLGEQQKSDGLSAANHADQIVRLYNELMHLNGVRIEYEIIETKRQQMAPGEKRTGYQHGANFIVPPGYPNDSFPFMAESGERVIVMPKNVTNNYFNYNQHSNASSSTLMRDFQFMKAMAG
jgi:uncharacterized coiled-coil protein SlyX